MKQVIGEVRINKERAAQIDMIALIQDVREIGELIRDNCHMHRAYIYRDKDTYYPLRLVDYGTHYKCMVDFETLVTPEPDEWCETWFIFFQPKPPREEAPITQPTGEWDAALLRACKPFKEVPF